MALNFIGVATAFAGVPAEAVGWHEQSQALAEQTGNREAAHRALNGLGIAYWALGRLDESLTVHQRVLDYCRAEGHAFGEMSSLACLAESHVDAGRPEQARLLADEALALARKHGDRRVEANLIRIIATIRHDTATYEQALRLCQEIGFRHGETAALIGLAGALRTRHDPAAALTCGKRALALMRENGALLLEPDALAEIAHDQLDLGDKAAATTTATHAVRLAAQRQRQLVEQRARRVLRLI